jgi:hypothetical protein
VILNDFDYDNVDPETMKEWDREYRNKCRREMTQYLKDFPDATPEEKRALSSWVRSGHSPYVNDDNIVNDYGRPMDFINALRFLEDEYQEYLKDPEGYRGKSDDGIHIMSNTDPNSDLPF